VTRQELNVRASQLGISYPDRFVESHLRRLVAYRERKQAHNA